VQRLDWIASAMLDRIMRMISPLNYTLTWIERKRTWFQRCLPNILLPAFPTQIPRQFLKN
jgi:hypothetical protein